MKCWSGTDNVPLILRISHYRSTVSIRNHVPRRKTVSRWRIAVGILSDVLKMGCCLPLSAPLFKIAWGLTSYSNHTITTFCDLKQRKERFLREHKKDGGVAFDISMDVHSQQLYRAALYWTSAPTLSLKMPTGITRDKKEGSMFFLFVLMVAMTCHRCVAHVIAVECGYNHFDRERVRKIIHVTDELRAEKGTIASSPTDLQDGKDRRGVRLWRRNVRAAWMINDGGAAGVVLLSTGFFLAR
ncbi:unnamed protein product [Brugia pahangi]|uniref:Uncharacterized protein n=1 Tax=Brugia pahangi TaxID=6280 RepID=A0A0N4SYF4_BRUPA|nr:unnamed protein product [Brugia pahangi]